MLRVSDLRTDGQYIIETASLVKNVGGKLFEKGIGQENLFSASSFPHMKRNGNRRGY